MAEQRILQGRVSVLADGLQVRRVLPSARQRSVGPFVFFDHMGPVDLKADVDNDVGGHPHIGLATVSYLFEGSLMHRDSLGSVQKIEPGDINWMTAGRGIVHSERTPGALRGMPRRLHGLQLWVALPPELEEIDPSFQHVPASDIPQVADANGVVIRVLVGEAFGRCSPVKTTSPTLYLDVQIPAHTRWTLPALFPEMAVYSPQHDLTVNAEAVEPMTMVVLPQGIDSPIEAGADGARLVVIGGAPLKQPVRMWWNYVSTDMQRIAAAAKRWEAGEFAPIPGESQRIAGPAFPDKL